MYCLSRKFVRVSFVKLYSKKMTMNGRKVSSLLKTIFVVKTIFYLLSVPIKFVTPVKIIKVGPLKKE